METIDGGCTSSDGEFKTAIFFSCTFFLQNCIQLKLVFLISFSAWYFFFSFIKIESLNELSELLESGDAESHTKKKTKRMRTTFTEEQVQILQANFQIDSNPDGQDLERIAQITGLSKRVTQVRKDTEYLYQYTQYTFVSYKLF